MFTLINISRELTRQRVWFHGVWIQEYDFRGKSCCRRYASGLHLIKAELLRFWSTSYAIVCVGNRCRTWGSVVLFLAFIWQMYTKWQLIMMHEPEPGKRHRSYIEISQEAFGSSITVLNIMANTFQHPVLLFLQCPGNCWHSWKLNNICNSMETPNIYVESILMLSIESPYILGGLV